MLYRIFAAVFAVLLLSVTFSFAARSDSRIEEPWLNVNISNQEGQMMREYYQSHPLPPLAKPSNKKMKSLPPGLQKKVARGKGLPPGWQKKLARGEVMDGAVYAYAQPLPVDLARRLPPQPSGVVTVQLEGKIVRLAAATLVILDVFDVLR
jgi:hypothetical protein